MKRTYRTNNAPKIFCVVFLSFSLFFSVAIWRGISAGTNTWLDFAIGILLLVVGSFSAAQTFTARVVLSDHVLSYMSLFRSHSLHRDQILYRREYEVYKDAPEGGVKVSYLELVPAASHLPTLKIPKNDFQFDQEFWEFVLRIPEQ